VILRTGGRADPPRRDPRRVRARRALLEGEERHARRRARRADRERAQAEGRQAGLVEVHGGKNVHLRREETRLRRVLDARIED
jgi:hypothetical protein